MTQQRRLLLAIGLSMGVVTAWSILVDGPNRAREAARLAELDAGVQAQLSAAAEAQAHAPTAAEPPQLLADDGGVTVAAAPVALQMRTLPFERATMKLDFTTEGAGLQSAVLLGARERVQKNLTVVEGFQKLFGKQFEGAPQMNMAEPAPALPPHLGVSVSGASPLNGRLRYAVTEESPGRVTFVGHDGPWEVTKTFTWDVDAQGVPAKAKAGNDRDPRAYQFAFDVSLKNTSTQRLSGDLSLHLNRGIDPSTEEAPSFLGSIGNQAFAECVVNDKLAAKNKIDSDAAHRAPEEGAGTVNFIALDQQYFVSAIWPKDGPVNGHCLLDSSPTIRHTQLVESVSVAPGETITKRYESFLGPKDVELLAMVGTGAAFQPNLEKTVDFGVWAVICRMLLFFLRFFHSLAGNWGWAIILLTVMVKVVLLPLTHRSMVNGEKMRDVQLRLKPSLDDINAKYANDPQMKQTKMMELYQKEGINPLEQLTGCLPLFLQLPIWGALFTTLRTSYDLYGAPFLAWSDLTHKDPTYLLPIALGATMIITQRLQPQMTTDKTQLFMFQWIMPVFFTAIMFNYPAGLALYIFVNNLLSILQQYALRRYINSKKPAGSKIIEGKKAGAA